MSTGDSDEARLVAPDDVVETLPVDIVVPAMLVYPPAPGPFCFRMLEGTSLRPLWIDTEHAVHSFLFDGTTYRVESNELLTTITSTQTRRRRREAMRRLGLDNARRGNWIDRTIDSDIKTFIDGVHSRSVM